MNLFAVVFVTVIPAAIICALRAVLESPWFKGKFGEFIVNRAIIHSLDKKQYHLIRDVTLPTEDGTTQIDHIVVSIFGVFVIETKNMSGWIFGRANESRWTQTLSKRHSYPFQNPLRQNDKHVYTLLSLGLNKEQVHPMVVFVGGARFKRDRPANVFHTRDFVEHIKSKTEHVFSPAEVKKVIRKIQTAMLARSYKTDREHVRHVQKIKADAQMRRHRRKRE